MQKNISIFSKISLILIKIYQKSFSGLVGRSCRFYPTCSDYAIQAITEYGFFKGWSFALNRIARCNPWGGSGFDPLKKKQNKDKE